MYVIADLPYPPRGGNDLRYAQGLSILDALGWDVNVVAGAARTDRREAGVGPHANLAASVQIPRAGTGPRDRVRRLSSIAKDSLRRYPVDPWAQPHRAAGFDNCVMEAVRHLRPDAIVVRSLFAHLIPRLRAYTGRIVVDVHDAGAQQARALLRTVRGLARTGLLLRLVAARRAESMLGYADELWVVSEVEAAYLRSRNIVVRTVLVRNTLRVPEVAPRSRGRGPELLLIAGYGYPPNVAAARTLVEDVLPAVRQAGVDARATLVGRDLPQELADRWSRNENVSIMGVADDVSMYLERAGAVVFLPSWSTGTPLKVTEALAAGVPLIANTAAVAGLGDIRHGEHFLLADTPEIAAAHATRVLVNRDLQERLAVDGWKYARDVLSFDAALDSVSVSSVLGNLPPEAVIVAEGSSPDRR
jgi:glycosyltransferase involved in cell wall biosynthesis